MNEKYQKIIKELKKSPKKKEFFEELRRSFQKHYDKCLLDVIQLDLLPPFYLSLIETQSSDKILKEFKECRKSNQKDGFIIVGSYYIYPISIDENSRKYLLVFNGQIKKYYDEIKAFCDLVSNMFESSMKNYKAGFDESSVQNANLISQMSHDINSMISLIKSNVPEIEKSISDKINYTEHMTKDILQYVRGFEILKSEVEIVELMDSIINTISVPNNIEIYNNYKVGSEPIDVDVELINKAITEIINNSIASIGEKPGKITIAVWTEGFENILIKYDYLVIKIEDNGKGINNDFLDLVKDPFFTTRKAEYHSGLGFSIANNIIEAHGGEIRIENTNKNKTVVAIYLPIQEKENE